MIELKPVNGAKMLKTFIDFPHDLYSDDPNYVPELFIAQRDLLTPGKHPFHEHSRMELFLAYEDGKLKGRIAAVLNENHNAFNKATDGFFGFFDCVNDPKIAAGLFAAGEEWLKKNGATTMIGPVSPSTNEACGLLIEGFDTPPYVMTVYNKPYYSSLIDGALFQKKVDLLAYQIEVARASERSIQLEQALLKRLARNNIVIRPVNKKKLVEEAAAVKQVYNDAWDENLGFVPMTDKEFQYMAKDLKMILDSQLCLVAEHEGKIIGFALTIPDINQALIGAKRGRLLPVGVFKILGRFRSINQLRVMALGVVKEYRKMGIEACFYAALIRRARERKMKLAEASWILEHNELMNKGILDVNGKVNKRYRIYEKQI